MALLPEFFTNCVVAIGSRPADASEPVRWVATGFFYGAPSQDGTGARLYLVTNRHVAEPLSSGVVRVNSAGSAPPAEFALPDTLADGEPLWYFHSDPEIDVAIAPVRIDFSDPVNSELSRFAGDRDALTSGQMQAQQMREGDGVFLLGFPMGLVGAQRNTVIVRGGHIARIRDLFDGTNKSFLVDSWVFPGNSGGPAVSRPELTFVDGSPIQPKSNLIGIVSQYLTYSDVAVSQQTERPRIVFEENAGLSVIFPVECIDATIADFEATYPLQTDGVLEPEIVEVEEDDLTRDVPAPTLPPQA